MKNLKIDTLEDIRRHKDKLLKLASFFSQSQFSCFTDNISRLPPSSCEAELIIAIDKDLNKTADFISKASRLLSTTNEEGVIVDAKGKPTLSNLFDTNYDPITNTITLGDINITIGDSLSKEDAKNKLMKGIFGITSADFASIKKLTKKVYTINKSEINSREDAVMYLAELPLRAAHSPILTKIRDIKNEADLVRANYVDRSKTNKFDSLNLIDRQITGSRAMIDSITKASTHISSSMIHQRSPKHKEDEVNVLFNLVKDNEYISDIEIDPDADILKVVDLVTQIKGLKLNLNNDFTLKIRKLGNYKASGLCVPSQSIVSVNVDKPSSLIHELTHLVDLTNNDIKNSTQREIFISKFREKLSLESYAGKANYFSSDEEIIARLGEISYLLNKFDYTGGDFNHFIDKTRELESNMSEMCTVKGIDSYLANPDIYFGIGNTNILPEADLLEIKDFYQTHWGINKGFISETIIYTQEDREKYSKKSYKKTNKSSFTPTSFSNINENSVIDSYQASFDEGVINPDDFAKEILINMQHLFRSKKRIRGEEVERQFRTVDNLFRHILSEGSSYDKSQALTSIFKHSGNFYLGTISTIQKFIENLPIDEASILFDESTYLTNDNQTLPIHDNPDCTVYLNDYGRKVAHKMTSLLTCDFINSMDSDTFNNVLMNLKPNSKAFYEAILLRQQIASPDDISELITFLSDKGWLSLFKFDRVELLAKRLDSRHRSLTTVTTAPLYPTERKVISDSFSNIVIELQETPDTTPSYQDIYRNPDIKSIIRDEITSQMSNHYISDTDHDGSSSVDRLNTALYGELTSRYLKELGDNIDSPQSSWIINKTQTTPQPQSITNKLNI